MHPTLFHLGSFPVGTYGVLLALALGVSLWWLRRLARAQGMDAEALTDLVMGALLCAVLGAKLLLIITDWHNFIAGPGAWLRDNLRAFGVFYGGFIAAVLYLFFAVRRRGLSFLAVADVMAPPLVLAQAIGRWGCFFAGCCHGHITQMPWAVTFRDPDSLVDPALLYQPLHPVQLYESFGNFVIAALLAWGLRRKLKPGLVFTGWLLFYGATRFVWEYFRGDGVRGLYFGGQLSTSQLIAAGLVALGAGLAVWITRNENAEKSAT